MIKYSKNGELDIISKGLSNNFEGLSEKTRLRCRIIPFSSVGKNNGMFIGFKPDFIKVYIDEEEFKIVNNVIIGIYNGKLSKNDSYSGLIGLEILNCENGKTGDLNEYNTNAKI